MKPSPDPHYRHRFPAEIIGHSIWLYHVFSLSLRLSYFWSGGALSSPMKL
jgi:hypothetical protein